MDGWSVVWLGGWMDFSSGMTEAFDEVEWADGAIGGSGGRSDG